MLVSLLIALSCSCLRVDRGFVAVYLGLIHDIDETTEGEIKDHNVSDMYATKERAWLQIVSHGSVLSHRPCDIPLLRA
jgi:hypothetical protein